MTLNEKLTGCKYIAQEKLQAILCSIPQQKDLIIEPALIKPLEQICSASWLRSKGIKKIYKFDQKNAPVFEGYSRIYFISANVLLLKFVLDQITATEHLSPTSTQSGLKKYHIIIIPDVYTYYQILVEEEGLYGVCQLHRFNWNFIKLDHLLLSLEVPQVFNEVFILHDTSILTSVAQSLRTLNILMGEPTMILTWGQNALKVSEILLKFDKSKTAKKSNDISTMLIVDRCEDYSSCLMTPATYSGLLCEVFKCSSGELEINSNSNKICSEKLEIFKVETIKNADSPMTSNQKTTIKMNSQHDTIYGDNRFLHFSDASRMIQQQAKSLGVEVQSLQQMKLEEIHDYVSKKLPTLTVMKNKILKHMNVCEIIIKELAGNFQKQQILEEDALNCTNRKQILAKINEIVTVDCHKFNTIRLLCLVHQTMKLNNDELTTFIQNYCNVFGHKYLSIFNSLAKAKLLPEIEASVQTPLSKTGNFLGNLPLPKFQQSEFQINANRLKLLPSPQAASAGNLSNATQSNDLMKLCPSYVFNGTYIPLIAQLASFLIKADSTDDLTVKLGNLSEKLHCLLPDTGLEAPISCNLKNIQQSVKKGDIPDKFPIKKTLLIFVIGGVSYAEISACDMVSKLTGSRIIIASNSIVTGNDLISSASL